MKIGSIVECVGQSWFNNAIGLSGFSALPIKGNFYTVNYIEDGYIGLENMPSEDVYRVSNFREIQFPDDLQEQIEECLTRELILV